MTSPETLVTLTLEKSGAGYQAGVSVRHDFRSHVDEHAHQQIFASRDSAVAWGHEIARIAGATSVRVLERDGRESSSAAAPHS
ncbi:MAG: hypothetical protein SFV21_14395 [Rhodospirillaceae bacterium]|nr:hypothetical protein [Rhodospirillaceae bacterium]